MVPMRRPHEASVRSVPLDIRGAAPDDMSERLGVLPPKLEWANRARNRGRQPAPTGSPPTGCSPQRVTRTKTWESAEPLLFCYRHAVELHLKALLVPDVAHTHGLVGLIAGLRGEGLRATARRTWSYLCARLSEFASVDPRSTAFRYADATPLGREPELWLDFNRLSAIMDAIFGALESGSELDFMEREAAP